MTHARTGDRVRAGHACVAKHLLEEAAAEQPPIPLWGCHGQRKRSTGAVGVHRADGAEVEAPGGAPRPASGHTT